MSDMEFDMPLKEPPLDSVLDGYYSGSQYTDKAKLTAIKNVMKSAISITKSKTGHVILKMNRFEGARLKGKIDIVRKEKTFAEVDINRSKIVFKAQYGKWMNVKNLQPMEIQGIKSRYRNARKKIRQKELANSRPDIKDPNSKWSKLPLGPIPVTNSFHTMGKSEGKKELEESSTEKIGWLKKPTIWESTYQSSIQNLKTPQEKYPYSYPRTETASRNASRQMKRRAALWREETFDMTNIRNLLEDNQLKQESLFCKQRIQRWKTQMLERQKTINEELKLTVTQRENSASSISSSESSSHVSSSDHQPVFPRLLQKLTPSDSRLSKERGTIEALQDKSVTFNGREVVSLDGQKGMRRTIQSRATVAGDLNVKKQISGSMSDRSHKRITPKLFLGEKGKTMLL